MLSNEEKQQVVIRIVDDDIGVREAISFDLECRGWITRTYESAKQFWLLTINLCLVVWY